MSLKITLTVVFFSSSCATLFWSEQIDKKIKRCSGIKYRLPREFCLLRHYDRIVSDHPFIRPIFQVLEFEGYRVLVVKTL